MLIGILALQGGFIEHESTLKQIQPSVKTILIRSFKDVNLNINALVIPGGESTTMTVLLNRDRELLNWLRLQITENRFPTLCTCAGLIMLSKKVESDEVGMSSGIIPVLDIHIVRNWYGRQQESFIGKLQNTNTKVMFIRAPFIREILDNNVVVIDRLVSESNEIVAIQQDNIIGLTHHPELVGVDYFHRLFLDICNE